MTEMCIQSGRTPDPSLGRPRISGPRPPRHGGACTVRPSVRSPALPSRETDAPIRPAGGRAELPGPIRCVVLPGLPGPTRRSDGRHGTHRDGPLCTRCSPLAPDQSSTSDPLRVQPFPDGSGTPREGLTQSDALDDFAACGVGVESPAPSGSSPVPDHATPSKNNETPAAGPGSRRKFSDVRAEAASVRTSPCCRRGPRRRTSSR